MHTVSCNRTGDHNGKQNGNTAPVPGGEGDDDSISKALQGLAHVVGDRPEVVLRPFWNERDAEASAEGHRENEAITAADAALPRVHDADARHEHRRKEERRHAAKHAVGDARKERSHLGKDAQQQQPACLHSRTRRLRLWTQVTWPHAMPHMSCAQPVRGAPEQE